MNTSERKALKKANGISDKKEAALELVMSGLTDGEVAKRVGVGRQCVNQWRNQDAVFMYELEVRRQALREKHMDSLNQLVEQAIGVLREALKEGDLAMKLRAAMYVLKASGVAAQAKAGKAQTRQEMEISLISTIIGEVGKEIMEEGKNKIRNLKDT